MADAMPVIGKNPSQLPSTLTGPAQRRHGIATGIRVNQSLQSLEEVRVMFGQPLPPSSWLPEPMHGEGWLVETPDGMIDGRARESGDAGHEGDTPAPKLFRIDSSDQVLLSL